MSFIILHERENSHEHVVIKWSRTSCRVRLLLTEKASKREHKVIVPNEKALDAFVHPYCYI